MKRIGLFSLLFCLLCLTVTPARAEDPVTSLPRPTLAIIDTALDSSIPSIRERLIGEACILDWPTCPNGRDFMEGSSAAYLSSLIINTGGFDHGTQMTSIAISSNPDMNILFIRIVGNSANGARQNVSSFIFSDVLNWIIKNREKYNVTAIAMSQGNSNTSARSFFCKDSSAAYAIRDLWSVNIPVFLPTGNDGNTSQINWPACIPEAVAVGGAERNSQGIYEISKISSYEEGLVDLWAPITAKAMGPGGTWRDVKGTSVSTQIAAAQYVAMTQKLPGSSVSWVLNEMKNSAIPITNSLNQFGRLILIPGLTNSALPQTTVSPTPVVQNKPLPILTITCTKGKKSVQVSAIAPVCPSGYRKK